MLSHPAIFGRLLFSFVVCLLLCGIVSAEIPELLSLTDNASNDFTIHKTCRREFKPTLSAAIHKSLPPDTKNFECGAHTHCASTFVGVETISTDLLVLHSVLRR
jgi:hypothetical protein